MKKFLLVLLIFSCLNAPLFAGGSGVYPNGAEGFFVGMVPLPGFYGENYFAYMNLPKFEDQNGDDNPLFNHGTTLAEVLRFIWISNHKILGGFYGQHVFIPFLYNNLEYNAPVGPKGASHFSDFNLPYIIYSPFLWSIHKMKGKLHIGFSLCDIYIPTSDDDDKNLANVSHNYWTFEPLFAITYLPGRWEISFKFMYDFSTKEDDHPTPYGLKLDRDPGQEFHFDYNVSYGINRKFRIGLGGFWYQQTTDDDYHDIDKKVANLPPTAQSVVKNLLKGDENHHSKAFAIGPGIWMNIGKFFVTVRYQQTFYERNYPEMRNLWVKVFYKFK